MKLSDILVLQKKFDSEHRGKFDWDQKINDDNNNMLDYLLIGLLGALGEFSNIIKKIHRGDVKFSEKKDALSEELIDIFIYVLKLAYQCDIDIESEYLKKLKINKNRFEKFKKTSDL